MRPEEADSFCERRVWRGGRGIVRGGADKITRAVRGQSRVLLSNIAVGSAEPRGPGSPRARLH